MSVPPRPSRADPPLADMSGWKPDPFVARAGRAVHLPAVGHPSRVRRLRGSGLAGPPGAGGGVGLSGHRRPCRSRTPSRIVAGGGRGRRCRPSFRCAVPDRAGGTGRRDRTWRPGPGRPVGRYSAPKRPRGIRPTTRRRPFWPTCSRRRCTRPGRHAGRSPPPSVGAAAGRDGSPRRPPGSGTGGATPPMTIPATCGTASATSWFRCVPPWPAATWCRCWPGRPAPWPATPTCSTPCPPWSTPRMPRPWPLLPSRWPGGACAAWLLGDGDHPPSLDAVDRVLDVARQRRRATEVPGGRRVTRSHGRLFVGPDPRARSRGARIGGGRLSGTVAPWSPLRRHRKGRRSSS